jgi:5-methylcytosine-specific restriction endonuclease McrA
VCSKLSCGNRTAYICDSVLMLGYYTESKMKLRGITYPKVRTKKGYNGSGDPFYQSREWKQDRLLHLMNNPLCKICQEKGKTTEATVSDHITPIKQGGDKWDWNNRQGLCKNCNSIKTALDNDNNGFNAIPK